MRKQQQQQNNTTDAKELASRVEEEPRVVFDFGCEQMDLTRFDSRLLASTFLVLTSCQSLINNWPETCWDCIRYTVLGRKQGQFCF